MYVYENNSSGNIAVLLDSVRNDLSSKGWFYFKESDLSIFYDFKCSIGAASLMEIDDITTKITTKMNANGENKNMKSEKILGLWKKAGMEYIEEETAREEDTLASADATYIQLLKHVAEINRIVSECGYNEDGKSCVNDCKRFVSNETKQKIRLARSKASAQKNNLSGLVEEIAAMLSACDTYEQEMDVLRTYNVIDEDGRLNKIFYL